MKLKLKYGLQSYIKAPGSSLPALNIDWGVIVCGTVVKNEKRTVIIPLHEMQKVVVVASEEEGKVSRKFYENTLVKNGLMNALSKLFSIISEK